jgi:hypothetical protein
MTFAFSQTLSSSGSSAPFGFLLILLLSMTTAVLGPAAHATDGGGDAAVAQQSRAQDDRSQENHDSKPNGETQPGAPPAAPNLCEVLATAATTNELPVDFFDRLIWQESRFKPDAVSPKGAQGIAQFMPATARLTGLGNPFNPLEAIAKSGELLRSLRDEFGNLGLAAAAYNAGPARVHDWLGGLRPLPQETRAYVRVVTGRSVEEWTGSAIGPIAMFPADVAPCNLPVTAAALARPAAPPPKPVKPNPVKPWGVEVVGGPTPAKALARYREWQSKYATILTDREPRVVIRGILGEMGAVHVRLDEDTRGGADKLCAALKAAGSYCDVWRN